MDYCVWEQFSEPVTNEGHIGYAPSCMAPVMVLPEEDIAEICPHCDKQILRRKHVPDHRERS